MKYQGFAVTKKGTHRDVNEDYFVVDDRLGFYLVCDGMRGHRGGKVASKETADIVVAYLQANRPVIERAHSDSSTLPDVEKLITAGILHACKIVHEKAASDIKQGGMGTSCTLVLFLGSKAIMAHVGGTKLYLGRNDTVEQLSQDHTFAAVLARSGLVSQSEVHRHRFARVLTHAVGIREEVKVDTLVFDLLPGDTLLLASDGILPGFNSGESFRDALKGTTENIPIHLTSLAISAGSGDDITALVVRVTDTDVTELSDANPRTAKDIFPSVAESYALYNHFSVNLAC